MNNKNSEKIDIIISELKKLTLVELNFLIKEIETVFNIDASISSRSFMTYPIISQSLDSHEQKESVKEEKTLFNVILSEVPTQNKIAILKVIRSITGLGLKESKEIIDTIPKIIKEGIEKEESEDIKKQLENAGAKVTIN